MENKKKIKLLYSIMEYQHDFARILNDSNKKYREVTSSKFFKAIQAYMQTQYKYQRVLY